MPLQCLMCAVLLCCYVQAAKTPQYGTCWQYNRDLDPWTNRWGKGRLCWVGLQESHGAGAGV